MKTISGTLLFVTLVLSTAGFSQYELQNRLVDEWHKAAAIGDSTLYFSFMSADFHFLGTDPQERWTKEQFEAFCLPYFRKGKGWDFSAKERHWKVLDKNTLVFDELLTTWMGTCRASGILRKKKRRWVIVHYNLHVLVKNDKMEEFIGIKAND